VTIAFILAAALMLLAALAFVLVPLLRGGATDMNAESRRRLKALESAHADGVLTEEEYAAKRAALDGQRHDSLAADSARGRPTFLFALAVALALPAGAILLYRELGAPQALDPASLVARPDSEGHGDIDAAIAQLAEKMRQEPGNAEGWVLLGRAYKSTRRFAEARDALKHAHELAPDDAGLTVDYAETLVLAGSDRRIQGEALALIEQAIKADPQNQKGLWLAGIADSQAGHYDDAVAKWNALLALLPPNSDVAASVREQIAQAEALRDGKPLPAASTQTASQSPATAGNGEARQGSAAAAVDPHIAVKVALDPKLKDKIAPTDTLFVFAKAAAGPPMPLAIAKLSAAQLPASVTLTDAMSMMPNMKISAFAQIIIGARISKSGQAIAQSGDLQALSSPLPNTRSEPVELTIDQIVP
jgi:cytochrome c-type biogenesis protein CcmH